MTRGFQSPHTPRTVDLTLAVLILYAALVSAPWDWLDRVEVGA